MEHFINTVVEGLIQTRWFSIGKIMIMYQPDQGRIIVVATVTEMNVQLKALVRLFVVIFAAT